MDNLTFVFTDGSRLGSGDIAIGVLLIDNRGSWINGVSAKIGIGEVIEAELWAIKFGLDLVKKEKASRVVLRSDSAVAVEEIKAVHLPNNPCGNLIADIIESSNSFASCAIVFTPRQRNQAADKLAFHGQSLSLGPYYFNSPPDFLAGNLENDISFLGLFGP